MSSEKSAIIAVGIDVGGTHTRLGVVDGNRRIVASRRCRTIRDADGSALLDWLVQAVDETLSDVHTGHHDAVPIGLALPGILDRDRQVVERSVSLSFLENRPIAEQLAERTARPVRLVTDAEAATWGEYISRSPRPRNFVHLRLGTGIGCGAVVEGKLQRLDLDRTGHLDELVIANALDSKDVALRACACPCGKRGCLETIASGPGLIQRAALAGYTNAPLSALQRGWEQGDPGIRAILDETTLAIALALDNLANRFDPDVICIGGGVAMACPCLVAETKQRIVEIQTPSAVRPVIESAILGDDAGILGAALLASDACPTKAVRRGAAIPPA